MMQCTSRNTSSVSCPANTSKAVVSFAFSSAARFFSVLRFYFYGFYFFSKTPRI